MSRHIVFINTHPIQYIIPIYQELALDKTIDFEVIYLTDETIKGSFDKHFGREIKWDIPLLDHYNYKFIRNYSWKPSLNNGFFGLVNFGIIKYLWRIPSNSLVIVSGWSNFTFILAILIGKLFRHKIGIRCDAPAFIENNKSGIFNVFRKKILKTMFSHFMDFGFYIGTENKRFYELYGMKEKKLIYTPFSVDNRRFSYEREKLKPNRNSIKKKFGIPIDSFIILFTGKFYNIKRPFDLLKAFQMVGIENRFLIMVGDGVLMGDMEKFIKDENIAKVKLPGFKNQMEISEFYAIADIFVLCSESETWGLSVNEAMNFGVPIVLYDSVGCATDLLKDGVNGSIVKKGDLDSLSEKIEYYGINKQKASESGKESIRIVNEYSNSKIIEGIKKALK